MKIMSLNVNQFRVLKLQEGSWAKEIVSLVKRFLCGGSDNVVFLHEIPYRNYSQLELYQSFRNSFPEEQYEISSPGRTADSCTLAIWKEKEEGWVSENCVLGSLLQETYANKYIELKGHNLRLMGIHAPTDSFDFLKALEKYAEDHRDEKLIILGDFNIATNKWRKDKYDEQMRRGQGKNVEKCENFNNRRDWLLVTMDSIGFSDAIDGETPTYFWREKGEQKGTTVDHVLISDKLKGKVVAQVIPQEILELSDHAVIIVDIRE